MDLDPACEIIQTIGSQEGLVHLPMAFCDPGDIVLSTNPAYVAYDAGIHLAGATPYYMPQTAENNFLPDLDAVPEEIAHKAKLLILNLPGNPVPAMPSLDYFAKVIAFAKKNITSSYYMMLLIQSFTLQEKVRLVSFQPLEQKKLAWKLTLFQKALA